MEETPAQQAHILVVDDNSVMRMKMRKAVQSLGHTASVAKDGAAGLEALAAGGFDAVLLDIVMPEMDGFEVLQRLKADPKLAHIPVIVVSSLDDEIESVVRAIELGAEDFLPKNFEPVLLRARLDASLAKKRYRDQELEYFDRIDRLTKAAEILESGNFNPKTMDLDELAAKQDPLGRLAVVFRGMAAEIYQRELKLKQTIDTLRGSFWVIVMGIIYGLHPSLGRIATSEGATPIGLMTWTNATIAVAMLCLAIYQRVLPPISLRNMAFFIAWAMVGAVLIRIVLLTSSIHVEAAVLSLVLTMQGFLVFGFSVVARLDIASPRRVLGLMVGLLGVGLVLWTEIEGQSGAETAWLAFAMLIPLLLAIEVMMIAGFRPKGLDDVGAFAMMMVVAAVIGAVWAVADDQAFALDVFAPGTLEFTVLGISAVSISCYLIAFHLIKTAGAVFYSQTAYTMTIAGVVWGVVLLDESLSPLAWAAFAVIVVGMYLVEPKADNTELKIKRKFSAHR